MPFAYDIVLWDKIRSEVNAILEFWQSALEFKGFR